MMRLDHQNRLATIQLDFETILHFKLIHNPNLIRRQYIEYTLKRESAVLGPKFSKRGIPFF